jgi:hypothetical protein
MNKIKFSPGVVWIALVLSCVLFDQIAMSAPLQSSSNGANGDGMNLSEPPQGKINQTQSHSFPPPP